MEKHKLTTKGINTSMAVFQLFNGLSGIFGGFMLVNDPSGKSLDMNILWLESTPFNNYLIPGIVLLAFNGIGNMAGFTLTAIRNKNAGQVAVLFGIFMIIWIIAQLLWIGYMSFLQPLYFLTGLIQLLLGIAWLRFSYYS